MPANLTDRPFPEESFPIGQLSNEVNQLPKAPSRKITQTGRKRRVTSILTSDKMLDSLRQEQVASTIKKEEVY